MQLQAAFSPLSMAVGDGEAVGLSGALRLYRGVLLSWRLSWRRVRGGSRRGGRPGLSAGRGSSRGLLLGLVGVHHQALRIGQGNCWLGRGCWRCLQSRMGMIRPIG